MRYLNLLIILSLSLFLLGCQKPRCPCDPLEPLNRVTFQFNRTLDALYLKPIARTYELIIPCPIRGLLTNFLQNINEIPNVANDLLQGRFTLAYRDTARFIINSTWGIGGLVDIAGNRGKLPRHRNDFGQTLAVWGFQDSSYLMLPLLGPSTIRDTIGLVADYFMYPPTYLRHKRIRNTLFLLNILDTRTALLKASPLIEECLDEYTFLRDAYIQHRRYQYNCVYEHVEPEAEAMSRTLLEGPPE